MCVRERERDREREGGGQRERERVSKLVTLVYTVHNFTDTKLLKIEEVKAFLVNVFTCINTNVPDPQTTKIKKASRYGPTGLLSSPDFYEKTT